MTLLDLDPPKSWTGKFPPQLLASGQTHFENVVITNCGKEERRGVGLEQSEPTQTLMSQVGSLGMGGPVKPCSHMSLEILRRPQLVASNYNFRKITEIDWVSLVLETLQADPNT